MDKQLAIEIVTESSKLFKENLEGRNVLFVGKNSTGYTHIETKFSKDSFLHLTGLQIDKSRLSAKNFYKKCLNNRLRECDFSFNRNGTTILKLSILKQMMKIHKISNTISNYNGSKPKLYTEKLAGNNSMCMGFRSIGKELKPDTLLSEDIDNISDEKFKVIMTLVKYDSDKHYIDYSYLADDVKLDEIKLPDNVLLSEFEIKPKGIIELIKV